MRHIAGTQASLPKRNQYVGAMRMPAKKKKMRMLEPINRKNSPFAHSSKQAPLDLQSAKTTGLFVMMTGCITVSSLSRPPPPCRVERDHQNLAQSTGILYMWLFKGEHHVPTDPFPSPRISEITMEGIVNNQPDVSGKYVVSLCHWIIPGMHAISVASMFGTYDPAQKL